MAESTTLCDNVIHLQNRICIVNHSVLRGMYGLSYTVWYPCLTSITVYKYIATGTARTQTGLQYWTPFQAITAELAQIYIIFNTHTVHMRTDFIWMFWYPIIHRAYLHQLLCYKVTSTSEGICRPHFVYVIVCLITTVWVDGGWLGEEATLTSHPAPDQPFSHEVGWRHKK